MRARQDVHRHRGPVDQKVYLDTSFFQDLERRFRCCDVGSKTCQFSQAYVIAHEIGHHVQNLLGILPKVQRAKEGIEQADANALQVRVELQADCLAGVWANRAQAKWQFIEPGDVEAALQTASAIGDDQLQRQSQGYVVPDAFTHGTSAQRARWFTTGLKSGQVASCDTFRAEQCGIFDVGGLCGEQSRSHLLAEFQAASSTPLDLRACCRPTPPHKSGILSRSASL
jgi:uncharacterized protein